jgi:hypothetical protein
MKNKLVIRISFLLITVLLLLIILNPFSFRPGGYSGIHLRDTSSVERIEICGKKTIILERDISAGWRLNDTFRANQVCINNFFYAFTKMSVSGISNDLNDYDSSSIRIRVFSGKEKDLFRFYPAKDKNLIHREGAKSIFSVELPGASTREISNVFSDDENYWRDRLIMDLLPDEISMIEVCYPRKKEDGFIIRVKDKIPCLYEPDGLTMISPEKTDTGSLKMYLSYFMNIYFDQSAKDGISPGLNFTPEPEYLIHVTPVTGKPLNISVYPILVSNQRDLFKAGIKLNNSSEMLIIRYIAIDLILGRKSDFIKKMRLPENQI